MLQHARVDQPPDIEIGIGERAEADQPTHPVAGVARQDHHLAVAGLRQGEVGQAGSNSSSRLSLARH
jgi:hypothetical protein